jgi:hypothetical protein
MAIEVGEPATIPCMDPASCDAANRVKRNPILRRGE